MDNACFVLAKHQIVDTDVLMEYSCSLIDPTITFKDVLKDASELLRITVPILSEHLDGMKPFLHRDAEFALIIEFRAKMIKNRFGNTTQSNSFVVEEVRKVF